ncbi:hypothetical protein APSETT444_007407 [Aspergillus pseudonomiae]
MPASKTNTKATKATKKRTEVEVERECMRDAIKDDRKSDLIIIAVAKEEVCAYLAKKYRRRWWHVGLANSNNEARPVFDTLIEIWNVAKYED